MFLCCLVTGLEGFAFVDQVVVVPEAVDKLTFDKEFSYPVWLEYHAVSADTLKPHNERLTWQSFRILLFLRVDCTIRDSRTKVRP